MSATASVFATVIPLLFGVLAIFSISVEVILIVLINPIF